MKTGLTVLGIVMILSLPVIMPIAFYQGSSTLCLCGFLIFAIGFMLVIYFYSFLLAYGLLFLGIGIVETIEQLVLSSLYPPFAISMFKWNKLLFVAVLYMLGAVVERYFRGTVIKRYKDGLSTWGEVLPLLLFIIALFILGQIFLFW